MTPTDAEGSSPQRPPEQPNSIVDLSETTENHGRPSTDTAVPVSNTENPFEEEQTEGFDIAPTGSGDLQEKTE